MVDPLRSVGLISSYEEAVAFLDARAGLGVKPGLERIEGLLDVMTNPHRSYRVIHVAGTNGKTTVTRMIAAILEAQDLLVGTFTSPHLLAIEERFSVAGSALSREAFVDAVADVAPFVEIFEAESGDAVTYFELTAAIAFQAFASSGVEVAVVEVGLGGRLDATNVVDADVSIVTGISLDHQALLGQTLGEIAGEKAGILKDGGLLVSGPLPPAAEGAFTARVAETNSRWLRFDDDFGPDAAIKAVGGWQADFRGVHGNHAEVLVPLHGRHQVDHFATALAACEMLFDGPLKSDAVRAASAGLTSPGRIEVVQRAPLVVVDGAHTAEGIDGLAVALDDEFPVVDWTLVFGARGDRDVVELLKPLTGLVGTVIATAPADPEAIPAAQIADHARTVFGDEVPIQVSTPVGQAVTDALHTVDEAGAVVIAGSLYVVGEALARLRR